MPTLLVVDMVKAVAFYERAGFGVRIDTDDSGDGGHGFALVDYDGQSVVDPVGRPPPARSVRLLSRSHDTASPLVPLAQSDYAVAYPSI